MREAGWVLVELECGDADGGAGGEVEGAEVEAGGGDEAGEARGVGHGEAEAFFDDAAEVGEGLDVGVGGVVFEDFLAEQGVSVGRRSARKGRPGGEGAGSDLLFWVPA